MLNQLVLVGRLVDEPRKVENKCIINLAIPRSFKNLEGEYETDIIECYILGGIADTTKEYCKKGDLVGVKGRIQMSDKLEVIEDKITFLKSNERND